MKLKNKILSLVNKYAKIYPSVIECGSKYIHQDVEAQNGAIELVSEIFDIMLKNKKLVQKLEVGNKVIIDDDIEGEVIYKKKNNYLIKFYKNNNMWSCWFVEKNGKLYYDYIFI